jgi:cysteinyl-tRNA synthetase
MELQLFNTKGRSLQPFTPLEPDGVKLYACGPTVYNFAHLGNLRTYVFEDLLVRTLQYAGFKVTHVMNITDVGHLTGDGDDGEDKLLKSAAEKGKTPWEIAEYYTEAFLTDTRKLNILQPTIVCKATEHIQDMIDLIKTLEDKGFTYTSAGNVYFDVSKFERYGDLALLDRADLKAGARIQVDSNKKNPQDFVLWFTNSKFGRQAMVWESPWGVGYPGWHIECSAMSRKYLGDQFDIHCGGVDHIPVHHTNEIAQTEAATGKEPWVNFWLHAEFLLTKDFKMSKSEGNFLTISALESMGFDPIDYRYFCLNAHYRTQLTFTQQAMESARSGRKSLFDKIAVLAKELGLTEPIQPKKLSIKAQEYLDEFEGAVAQDLNMPKALAVLWTLIKDQDLEGEEKLQLSQIMDKIFGLGLPTTLTEQSSNRLEDSALAQEIETLIEQRNQARKNKDFSLADQIRDELKSRGIGLVDTPNGTSWNFLHGKV